ncbi:MAG: hypothetical protein BWY93_00650 [Euryarchaeota archaeon ADurb.BinA087]|nr:MAG: hypothetical protein BWY93_00650 [Euryarchaeota archaeon ADurb.BinA087]HPX73257.1 antitoxin VapB family protein [Methanoregulaceae archaeon]HQA79691.1 antitoxin VapB family protein [Methanoregulaceae archaeon]
MATRTIRLTEEAYERLKRLKKNKKMSFSDVMIEHYPKRRTISEVLSEIGDCTVLTDDIKSASREILKAGSRKLKV